MAENNIQENLIKLKELRKNEIDNSNNEGVLIFNKVEFLGEGENSGKALYRVLEEYSVGENLTEEKEFFYEFENDEPKLIAIRNPETFGDIIPVDYPGEEGPAKEKWENELLDIEQCLEEKEKELKAIAKELGSPKAMNRMIGYLTKVKPKSAELIVDEMLAISSEISAWKEKKASEAANAAYNDMLNRGLGTENEE